MQLKCYSLQNLLLILAVHSVVERVIPWHGEAGAFWLAPKVSVAVHTNSEVQPLPSQSLSVLARVPSSLFLFIHTVHSYLLATVT